MASERCRILGSKPGARKKPIWLEIAVSETRYVLSRFENRKGWFSFAMARLRPVRKTGRAVEFVEKPVRIAALRSEGYLDVRAWVRMDP